MKRIIITAAALMLGSTAIAQTDAGSTTPERDARGIPVTSAPATAPSGANQAPATGSGQAIPAPNQSAVFAPQQSNKDYQPCTREVTDGCVQTYERGRSPN